MMTARGCFLGKQKTKKLSNAKNLGVIFDSGLKFDQQINAVVKNSFFHLRSISKLKSILSFDDNGEGCSCLCVIPFGLL